VLGNGQAGCGRRLGETHRWKHRQGAPSRPHFYCLEEVMDVWLLNAAHMKAVPGRKSDVRNAEWIAQLLEHGLLRPSFVPPPEIRRLRMLTRYRVQLMGDRAREIVRLELMLEDASIKLSSVASSLKTVSARAMLTAMINGESDPLRLADIWRRVGCGARFPI
jgi:transposase